MYGQDLDFVVVLGVLTFILLVLCAITLSIVDRVQRRRIDRKFGVRR